MILVDVKYRIPINYLPDTVYSVMNMNTREYVESTHKGAEYYLFHIGNKDDEFQRVIDLNYLEIVDTESQDNLVSYGFDLLKTNPDGTKRWIRR